MSVQNLPSFHQAGIMQHLHGRPSKGVGKFQYILNAVCPLPPFRSPGPPKMPLAAITTTD